MGDQESPDHGLAPASEALKFTCCYFSFYKSELLVLSAPVQGWPGLGLAITQALKELSAPKSLPSQKQRKFGGGVQTHKEPVLLETLEMPRRVGPPAWEGFLTSNAKPCVSCSHRGYHWHLCPSKWGVQGRAVVRTGQGLGGEALRRFPEGKAG